MPEETHRLFVGIDLDDEVRAGLAAFLTDATRDMPLPGRPSPPTNWHLTLRFLGPVPESRRDVMAQKLDEADLGEGFTLRFGPLGAFPRVRRATVLWVGIEHGAEELTDLAGVVEAAAVEAGFLAEERPFHPHLTLSRIRPPVDVGPWVDAVPVFPMRLKVDEVVLFRSRLQGSKPAVYERAEVFPLR